MNKNYYQQLMEKIKKKKIKISVIGIGYVGLPLVLELAQQGFDVVGFDINHDKIQSLNNGISYIDDISNDRLTKHKNITFTKDSSLLRDSDIFCICVPTPLKNGLPDVSCIEKAYDTIENHLRKGTLVILESSTYPGSTKDLICNKIKDLDFVLGEEVFVCYSPERIDPGNETIDYSKVPKVVGGYSKNCGHIGSAFYASIHEEIFLTNNLEEAELSKLIENSFRAVNISLINELSKITAKKNIDVWKAIEAAATKPFGFMPFYPGPGVGGHCIPVDPVYLKWWGYSENIKLPTLEAALKSNNEMVNYIYEVLETYVESLNKQICSAEILILGTSYKKNSSDVRNSSGIKLIKKLEELGAKVEYNDPYVERLTISSKEYKSIDIKDDRVIRSFDCIILISDHDVYDYKFISSNAAFIIDTRNVFNQKEKNVMTLGTKEITKEESYLS
ncbi:nucleotide sugar dehydrogenase [Bacillus toyonensis]|uniref:nucleotide sugar dehydrogenase n=1 Tax=Bacillus toyonensis TaxID=155322 RepID=UPI0018D0D6AE|nr:nucleotide sugar dehydrogenase [Bacillus toyonensis]MBH0357127.1 UDP-N-acetyl-D-glucosamine dehydrogenase [Bacillus toyonensis biovar Thuringiensis]